MKSFVKENINFFTALSEEKHASKGSHKAALAVSVVFLVMALAFFGVCSVLYNSSGKTEKDIIAVQAYIDENSAEYEQKSKTHESLQAYMKYNQVCSEYINELKGLKRISSEQFGMIDSQLTADTIITGYKFSDNSIEISCSAGNENAPAAFAKALADSKQFANVEYSGFDSNDNADGNKDYTFNIVCTLLG